MNKMICAEIFGLVYQLRVSAGTERAPLLEQLCGLGLGIGISEDNLRNQREYFEQLFSSECQDAVVGAYKDVSRGMAVKPFQEATADLCALAFIQDIVATAMWKYGIDVGSTLESFARDFDRLDLESERRRLHGVATGELTGD
jgi:hypothetical protein